MNSNGSYGSIPNSISTSRVISNEKKYKVVLVGDACVGKTSLFQKFTSNSFSESYKPTLGADQKTLRIDINGVTISLEFWDTAGQERFRAMTTSCYRNSHGFIIVYDITKEGTFNNITEWLKELGSYKCDTLPILLIGNKIDRTDREVDCDSAKRLAISKNFRFIEVSAMLSTNCDQCLQILGQMLLDSDKSITSISNSNIVKIGTNREITGITNTYNQNTEGGGGCCC
eukprot:TRINITY_DN1252_c0_g3_i1.p1 TRINITY_DN1252_c0_g3~~TRINITY_DN1252_c0_g3_i1.p1  ORF type:complete len:229 (+),score=86.94 TRINITY_DN1252_c0_g3_i1:66-752(+)